jgi:putative (di)nucleoside polyphosphate hydrolase
MHDILVFMTKPYFRPGTGTVIYNQAGEVLCFKRADLPDIWQLQQGGMDPDEQPIDTMWRELFEETGLTSADILNITEYPDWTVYTYNERYNNAGRPECLGQAHRWYFLELNPITEIDLKRATDQEFTDWRWSTFTELIAETGEMKKGIYTGLNNYFRENIKL